MPETIVRSRAFVVGAIVVICLVRFFLDPYLWFSVWSSAPEDFGALLRHPEVEPVHVHAGRWSGLLSVVTLHTGVIHLLWCLGWFWWFGRAVEAAFGHVATLGWIAVAAVASSAAWLFTSHELAAGLSGVNAALFGIILVAGPVTRGLGDTLTRPVIVAYLAWFVFCRVTTETDVWQVPNVPRESGLVIGLAFGAALRTPRPRLATPVLGATLLALSVVSVVEGNGSAAWIGSRALIAEREGRDADAIEHYGRIIDDERYGVWALFSRGVAHWRLGDLERARADVTAAHARESDWIGSTAVYWVLRANALHDRFGWGFAEQPGGIGFDAAAQEVLHAYDRARELDPGNVFVATGAATLLCQVGSGERAASILERIRTHDTATIDGWPWWWIARSEASLLRGEATEALRWAQRAIDVAEAAPSSDGSLVAAQRQRLRVEAWGEDFDDDSGTSSE